MRRRWVYNREGKCVAEFDGYGQLVWSADDYATPADPNAPMVIPDIQPYQSMATGEIITSRSQHRDHLRQHKLIEIGNETKYLAPSSRGVRISKEMQQSRREVLYETVTKAMKPTR